MKLVSWNVNGLRSALGKGFLDYVAAEDPDVICLQETKLQPEQAVFELEGYHRYFHSADKKGYSGTAVFTKHEPLSVTYGVGVDDLDHEGRMITLEYEKFYLVTCYTPNAQDALKRIDHRLSWDDAFRERLQELDARKPVIACGDLTYRALYSICDAKSYSVLPDHLIEKSNHFAVRRLLLFRKIAAVLPVYHFSQFTAVICVVNCVSYTPLDYAARRAVFASDKRV